MSIVKSNQQTIQNTYSWSFSDKYPSKAIGHTATEEQNIRLHMRTCAKTTDVTDLTEGQYRISLPQICILYHKLDIFFGKFKDFDTRLVCVGHLFNNFNCPAVR